MGLKSKIALRGRRVIVVGLNELRALTEPPNSVSSIPANDMAMMCYKSVLGELDSY